MRKSFNTTLLDLLKKDSRFVDSNGELLKSAVIDKAWKMDHSLVRLLLRSLDVKKKLLAELLNKNQLYVLLSEIDDKDFKVSTEDKHLNKLFFDKG